MWKIIEFFLIVPFQIAVCGLEGLDQFDNFKNKLFGKGRKNA